MFKWFRDAFLKLRAHKCPIPPPILMAVIAQQDGVNVWEQRQCNVCKTITHWRRDFPNEPFQLWTNHATNNFLLHENSIPQPVSIDLSNQT